MCSVVHHANPNPLQWLELCDHHTATIYICLYNLHLITWGAINVNKITSQYKSFTGTTDMNLHPGLFEHLIIYFVPSFNIIQKYMTSVFIMWCCQSLVFKLISSTFVSYVCGSMWRIIYLIFIASHCNHVISPIMRYHKWALIWHLIAVCRMIIKHDFISNSIVIVYFHIYYLY